MLSNPLLMYHPTCKGTDPQGVGQHLNFVRVWQSFESCTSNLFPLAIQPKVTFFSEVDYIAIAVKFSREKWTHPLSRSPYQHLASSGLHIAEQGRVIWLNFTDFVRQTPRRRGCNLWIASDRNTDTDLPTEMQNCLAQVRRSQNTERKIK